MPATTKPPAVAIASVIKTVSAALDEVAGANKKLLVQQKRMQTLLAELHRRAQQLAPRQARATRASATSKDNQANQESASASAGILKIQISMQRENLVLTSISNVLKTRHDTIKNSISNIR
jgi:hypothetical protein